MPVGPVENDFQGSVSFYSTKEMCTNRLGFGVFVARNSPGRGILLDMFGNLVKSSCSASIQGLLQQSIGTKHDACSAGEAVVALKLIFRVRKEKKTNLVFYFCR